MTVSPVSSPPGVTSATFELKSTRWSLLALLVKNTDLAQLVQALQHQFGVSGENPGFFDQDAVVIDVASWPEQTAIPDLTPLLTALKACGLLPVALRGANGPWLEMAQRFGLGLADPETARHAPELPASAPQPTVEPIASAVQQRPQNATTMVIDKPLRSGQKVYARGCDLVVLAMVNQGAEVVADGNIHVYAPLRGKAMAGASGNVNARIFSLCLEPELISIAGVYRTSENPLPATVQGKAAQVQLSNDGQDRLLINALTISY
ncbi:MAG: septum site-determining protein MinC [Betaproteobacteria bacterium]